MKRQKIKMIIAILGLGYINAFGQQKINLTEKLKNEEITSVNRIISLYESNQNAVEMDAKNGDGLGILEDIEFENGVIEVELLGENNPGKSFIGIAFNIQNDTTYEAVYFRPFNFVADEQIRKGHMVQYIFHPKFTWSKLRNDRTGDFEAEISNPPNPDDWFKAKIIITDEDITVYVNDVSHPVLKVKRLTSTNSKKIGLWTGNNSSGRFTDMIIEAE